jgi:hypothetical protein
MFDNLSCLIDAVNVLDSPSTSRTLGPEPRQERLASISSVASLCSLSGSTSPSVSPYLMPRTKVPRKRISPEQTCALQSLFDSGVHFPTRDMRERLARQLTLTSRTIQVWFQNRRQAARNRARGVDRPPPGQKLSIRWMKPVVFYTDSSHILDKERLWRPATPIETVVHSPESTADYT